ncbi:MAG: Unknown protein [uncultured Sulfurovum sp.]|uniref:DNA recombination protein RmuC n=1 Tax=uncultured Sulfurovum sp. TaxID=269237 RepID=A0A6S6SFD8_9BACT|nr:MAG: Unknown protein [uncultured Sulfurovum sp.]
MEIPAKLQEIITMVQNDATLMFIGAIALAVLIFIVMLVVISAMRVKVYKDRFVQMQAIAKHRAETISLLEVEMHAIKTKNETHEKDLTLFSQTKKHLSDITIAHQELKVAFETQEKVLGTTKTNLEKEKGLHQQALDDFKVLNERTEKLTEENTRFRTNNARLVLKLESAVRKSQ